MIDLSQLRLLIREEAAACTQVLKRFEERYDKQFENLENLTNGTALKVNNIENRVAALEAKSPASSSMGAPSPLPMQGQK